MMSSCYVLYMVTTWWFIINKAESRCWLCNIYINKSVLSAVMSYKDTQKTQDTKLHMLYRTSTFYRHMEFSCTKFPCSITYLLTYLLTYLFIYLLIYYCMQQNSFLEANRFSASKEIFPVLWNSKVHYCLYIFPPLVPILSQFNLVYTPISLPNDPF
jgi:hypothetical protein